MKPRYPDILELAGDRQPEWWDSDGVPRFAPFHPELGGVYDELAALALVECASCRRRFPVGFGGPRYHYDFATGEIVGQDLTGFVEALDYGDAPRHDLPGRPGDRCAGETMGSDLVGFIEAWERIGRFEWVRRPGLERVAGAISEALRPADAAPPAASRR